MALSGWCLGPPGARIHHENCPPKLDCGCPCHLDTDQRLRDTTTEDDT